MAMAAASKLATASLLSTTLASAEPGLLSGSGIGGGSASLCVRVARRKSLHALHCEWKLAGRRRCAGQWNSGAGSSLKGNLSALRWRIGASTQDEAAYARIDEPEATEADEESKEAWTQAVDRLAEEVQKLKGVIYDESSERALAILRETTEQLRDQAEKAGAAMALEESAARALAQLRDATEQLRDHAERARVALAASAQEAAGQSKANLLLIAESGPEPIRDIAETALDAHFESGRPENWARIHDFCLGIPYGALLTGGGVLWFVVSGSVAALRFGLFLGGLILFLSVSSLKAWRQGKSSLPYIQGQGVIALAICVREIRRFKITGGIFPTALVALASAAMFGFYTYVYLAGGNPPPKKRSVEDEYAT